MARMIFDDYEDNFPIPKTKNIIAPNRYELEKTNTLAEKKSTDSTAAAVVKTVGKTVAPIISLIDSTINIIPDILNSVSAMYADRQRTQQVKATAQVEITRFKEQTKQTAITESNETERVRINCQKEIELKRIELTALKKTLLSKGKESELRHEQFLSALSNLERIVDYFVKTSAELAGQINIVISNDDKLQLILTSLNSTNSNLVELSRAIVCLANKRDMDNA